MLEAVVPADLWRPGFDALSASLISGTERIMSMAAHPSAATPFGFIHDLMGSSFADLRLVKRETSVTFPVCREPPAVMTNNDLAHPEPPVPTG